MDSSESFLKSKRIHVNKSVSVIKMKSPDTIVYEQDNQMALCCSFFLSEKYTLMKYTII